MKFALWILMLVGTMLQLPSALAASPAAEPTVKLALFKVVSNGTREELKPAANIAPGDVVEYQAVYLNGTAKQASDVHVTLPIPAGGLEVLTAWRGPQVVTASIDGKRFEAMPLMRTQTLPDGTQVKRPVPVSEYRFLQWPLGDLPAGATRTVSARMQLPALSAAALIAPATSNAPSSVR